MAFFFQAEDGIRDKLVTGVQTCALPISLEDEVARGAGREGEVLEADGFRKGGVSEPRERGDVEVEEPLPEGLRSLHGPPGPGRESDRARDRGGDRPTRHGERREGDQPSRDSRVGTPHRLQNEPPPGTPRIAHFFWVSTGNRGKFGATPALS